jgi:plastocyanin
MRSLLRLSVCMLAAMLTLAPSALGATQTVSATNFQFTPQHVTLPQGDTVTWNNALGTHNVHFEDNMFDMPAMPSSTAWSVSRTFSTVGVYRYYCELHGGPNGSGMSGTVTVNGPGFPRPRGATPLRASLAPAYKPCTAANRSHGAPLSSPSCSPPVQVSNYLTVGSPDANSRAANSIGAVTLKVLAAPADVSFVSSLTDVRKKSDLTDYTGALQAKLPLRVTDKLSGPALNEPATGDTTLFVAIPCAGTGDTTVGSTCSIATTANAVTPGAVVDSARSVWELTNVQVFDGGADGAASTADNTLYADQAFFVP